MIIYRPYGEDNNSLEYSLFLIIQSWIEFEILYGNWREPTPTGVLDSKDIIDEEETTEEES